jgi:hypothetical protein
VVIFYAAMNYHNVGFIMLAFIKLGMTIGGIFDQGIVFNWGSRLSLLIGSILFTIFSFSYYAPLFGDYGYDSVGYVESISGVAAFLFGMGIVIVQQSLNSYVITCGNQTLTGTPYYKT